MAQSHQLHVLQSPLVPSLFSRDQIRFKQQPQGSGQFLVNIYISYLLCSYWKELEKLGLAPRAVWFQSQNSTEPGIKEQSRVPASGPTDVSRIQCTHIQNAQPPSQWTRLTHLDLLGSCSWCG